ncbi:MAG: hypothetical protein VXX91_07790 [Planctomycetota bacterium]|nr:hypothetical protein [Planctomycetota bacterium]
MMTPETHTRYRVQRLIRQGEWLQRNESFLAALYDAIDDAHTHALEQELDDTIILEFLLKKQAEPLRALGSVINDLRRQQYRNWEVQRGKDVTLHHPNACPGHQYEVVMKAPKPKTNKDNKETK